MWSCCLGIPGCLRNVIKTVVCNTNWNKKWVRIQIFQKFLGQKYVNTVCPNAPTKMFEYKHPAHLKISGRMSRLWSAGIHPSSSTFNRSTEALTPLIRNSMSLVFRLHPSRGTHVFQRFRQNDSIKTQKGRVETWRVDLVHLKLGVEVES